MAVQRFIFGNRSGPYSKALISAEHVLKGAAFGSGYQLLGQNESEIATCT